MLLTPPTPLPLPLAQVVHVEPVPARPARYTTPLHTLSEPSCRALAGMGIHQLFSHQVGSAV